MTLWSRRRIGGALAGAVVARALGGAAAEGPRLRKVVIDGFRFSPRVTTIRPSDRVRWTNRDLAPHTATGTGADWDTGALGRDAAAEVAFHHPGRFAYSCAYHPGMTGEIAVAEPD